jgi:hypothetical protein
MAMGGVQDREFNKFIEVDGKTTVRVTDAQALSELQNISGALGASSGVSVRSGAYLASVIPGVETDIFTYTVPVSKALRISSVNVGGNNIAEFFIYVDGSDFWKLRTNFGSSLFTSVPFYSYKLTAGQVLKVAVKNSRLVNGDFEAILIGELLSV